jgi:SWI/SNF-related matrix-associated actin-dependent regulator 1 of chromatin subfamily A
MLRRDKSILNLPKQTVSIETIDMDDRETYDVLHKKYVGAIRDHGLFRTKGADKLSLLTNLLMLVARCKARATVMWIRKFLAENPNEKLIVFAIHTKFIDVIQRRAAAEDESIVINGSVSAAKRTKLIEQFQNDPKKKLAICQIKAAGAGITLTAATTTVVAELPWTSRAVEQLNARNHRIGQDRDTRTIFLLTENTIEEKLCKAIEMKAGIAAAVIDGKPTHDLPLMTMLEESLMQ